MTIQRQQLQEEEKKKYAVVYSGAIFDSLEEAAKYYEKQGTQLVHIIYELGDEYEVEISSIVRKVHKKDPLNDN